MPSVGGSSQNFLFGFLLHFYNRWMQLEKMCDPQIFSAFMHRNEPPTQCSRKLLNIQVTCIMYVYVYILIHWLLSLKAAFRAFRRPLAYTANVHTHLSWRGGCDGRHPIPIPGRHLPLTPMTSVFNAASIGESFAELVQTCATVPLQNFEYLLLKKYDEKEYDILALDFMGM